MFFGLFSKKSHNRTIVDRQYSALTQAARAPAFYRDMGVPDTVMGRFEMLSVVMILFFRRTRRSAVSGHELAQSIVDLFFEDLDHSIRELGIGDQGVPKRMKKLAGMFYGRLEAYAGAMDAGETAALAAALQRNIHPDVPEAPDMVALANWMVTAEAGLSAQTEDDISRGQAHVSPPRSED
jgi:cytochrome b pre-mRNA-processing protein 3